MWSWDETSKKRKTDKPPVRPPAVEVPGPDRMERSRRPILSSSAYEYTAISIYSHLNHRETEFFIILFSHCFSYFFGLQNFRGSYCLFWVSWYFMEQASFHHLAMHFAWINSLSLFFYKILSPCLVVGQETFQQGPSLGAIISQAWIYIFHKLKLWFFMWLGRRPHRGPNENFAHVHLNSDHFPHKTSLICFFLVPNVQILFCLQSFFMIPL